MATARRLMAKDVFAAARIFSDARDDITAAVEDLRKKNPDSSEKELGMAIGFTLLKRADTDVRLFMADIAQKTPDEFDEMPLDDLIGLIEQVATQEDWRGFLDRVMGLANKQTPSSTPSKLATAGRTKR